MSSYPFCLPSLAKFDCRRAGGCECWGNDTDEPDLALAMNFPSNQKFAAAAVAAACRVLPGNGAGDGNRTHKWSSPDQYVRRHWAGKCDSSARFRGTWGAIRQSMAIDGCGAQSYGPADRSGTLSTASAWHRRAWQNPDRTYPVANARPFARSPARGSLKSRAKAAFGSSRWPQPLHQSPVP